MKPITWEELESKSMIDAVNERLEELDKELIRLADTKETKAKVYPIELRVARLEVQMREYVGEIYDLSDVQGESPIQTIKNAGKSFREDRARAASEYKETKTELADKIHKIIYSEDRVTTFLNKVAMLAEDHYRQKFDAVTYGGGVQESSDGLHIYLRNLRLALFGEGKNDRP